MAAKLLIFIAALHIAYVSATTGPLMPAFGGVGQGRIHITFLGIRGSMAVGKFLGDNSTDGGLLLQLRIPPGLRVMILYGGIISRQQGVGGHVLVGGQMMFGSGISGGIGFNFRNGMRFGLTVGTKTLKGFRTFEWGQYAPILTGFSQEFMKNVT